MLLRYLSDKKMNNNKLINVKKFFLTYLEYILMETNLYQNMECLLEETTNVPANKMLVQLFVLFVANLKIRLTRVHSTLDNSISKID